MGNPLYDALLGHAPQNGSPFLIADDGRDVSYSEFSKIVSQMANALVDLGARPADRVTVQVRKSKEALALYFATIGIGGIFSPLNTAYTGRETAYFIEDARPSLVVCDPSSLARVDGPSKAVGAVVETLAADGSGSLTDRSRSMRDTFEPADRDADDIAAILYTSGTTGASKGAMLTHNNLLTNAATLSEFWRFSNRDVLLHALPIFHAHGLFVATNTAALARASMIFLAEFKVDAVLHNLPRATVMMGVPTFYTRLLSDDRFTKATAANMRLFISGSAPLLPETHRRFRARTGLEILERYGMTETIMITSNPYDGERKAGSVGVPLPGIAVRIRDAETGAPLSVGETGVLEVAGPNVFKGYWNMPEKTADEFREDGFFVTGDLAKTDEDGYVAIVGRQKDLIISGGYNVYPKEVEALIDDVPNVKESAVIGVPHPDFGEAVVAVVVPDSAGALSADIVHSAIDKDIANFKRPKHIEIVAELPRNTMGKVQKNLLRQSYGGLFQ